MYGTIALDINVCLKIARNPTRIHNINDLHLCWYFNRNASDNSVESDLILIGIGNFKAGSTEAEFECHASYFKKGARFFFIRITGRGVAFPYSSRVPIDLTRPLIDGKRINNRLFSGEKRPLSTHQQLRS